MNDEQPALPETQAPPALPAPKAVPRRIVPVADGRTIACAEAGSGPDLVLIHGALMTLEDFWLGPVPRLARDFRCILVDRPGHGMSRRERLIDASPWRQAELIREAMRAIGVARPILLGHSFGGAVALAYAMAFPDEVAGVVALAPVCFPEIRLEQMLFGPRAVPFSGEVLADALSASSDPTMLTGLWRANFLPQAMPERFSAEFPFALAAGPERTVVEGEDAASLWPGLTRSAMSYPGCRVPVRILGGSADLIVSNARHGAVAAGMMPQARFAMLPGLGHMLHHFAIDAVAEAVGEIAPT